MKRMVAFSMILLLVTVTLCACASEPAGQSADNSADGGQAKRQYNARDNTNYRAHGGGGNGLF